MEFDDLFEDLEVRFGAMIAAAETQRAAQAIDLRLANGLPPELAANGGRILLVSPQIGRDFVAGVDAGSGNWYAIRMELIRELRRVAHPAGALQGMTAITHTDLKLADLMNDWLTPLRLKVLLLGERQLTDLRLVALGSRLVGASQIDGTVEYPIENFLLIRANFAELA
ncbi:MAG: hypothetical protein KGL41_02985 [Actinomycetales bacterium]|nr:hypothetical protein [Actinomycetales bacterium]